MTDKNNDPVLRDVFMAVIEALTSAMERIDKHVHELEDRIEELESGS